MQYLVLLPGLALVDRGELFIQSRTRVTCKDGARAERYPKGGPDRHGQKHKRAPTRASKYRQG